MIMLMLIIYIAMCGFSWLWASKVKTCKQQMLVDIIILPILLIIHVITGMKDKPAWIIIMFVVYCFIGVSVRKFFEKLEIWHAKLYRKIKKLPPDYDVKVDMVDIGEGFRCKLMYFLLEEVIILAFLLVCFNII